MHHSASFAHSLRLKCDTYVSECEIPQSLRHSMTTRSPLQARAVPSSTSSTSAAPEPVSIHHQVPTAASKVPSLLGSRSLGKVPSGDRIWCRACCHNNCQFNMKKGNEIEIQEWSIRGKIEKSSKILGRESWRDHSRRNNDSTKIKWSWDW